MASGWFGSKSIELVKARSLFVKVFPTPASLSERRAVLHALRRHGPIEIFKRLPNPETFVCAPTKSDVASEIISRSPLTFKYISETLDTIEAKLHPGITPTSAASPIQTIEYTAGFPPIQPQRGSTQSQPAMVKTFTMHVNPSQSYYEHKTNIRLSPIHGPWPKTPEQDQDLVYFGLRGVVPGGIAQGGLCDWHTGGQLSGEPAAIRAQVANSTMYHIRERQLRRRKSRALGEDEGSALVAIKSLGGVERVAVEERSDDSGLGSELDEVEPRGQHQDRVMAPDPFAEMDRLARGGRPGKPAPQHRSQAWEQMTTSSDPFMEMERLARGERPVKSAPQPRVQKQEQVTTASDPFAGVQRKFRVEDSGQPGPQPKVPAWVRRKQVKLNPLADGRHHKLDKKMPIPDMRSLDKRYEFRSVLDKSQMNHKRRLDDVRIPME